MTTQQQPAKQILTEQTPPLQPTKKKLKVDFGDINDKNINLLRKVNFETFPVKYSTSFYIKIALEYTKYSKFCLYNDIVIGAYTLRLEEYHGQIHAYIITFGVLEPYRRYGIGYQMMANLEKDIKENSKAVAIYLHMHVINEIGKNFYQKCGFLVEDRFEDYYTDLQEPHCFILRKQITADMLPYVRDEKQVKGRQKQQEPQEEQ